MIIVCVFLFLIVPAVNSGQSTGESLASEASSNAGKMFDDAEVAVRRAELDFLLGEWKVTTREGVAAGKSIFAYEKIWKNDSRRLDRPRRIDGSGDHVL